MKKLILSILLTASVWSSFTYAETRKVTGIFKQGASNTSVIITPNLFYSSATTDAEAILDYKNSVTVVLTTVGCEMQYPTEGGWTCTSETGTVHTGQLTFYVDPSTRPATQTCKQLEGAFIDGLHDSDANFCAVVGSTGGLSPQPLLCVAQWLIETPTGSGNWQHTVTAQTCSEVTGPIAGENPDPDPEPCTENCNPTDPETPPTGDNGSGIPSTGGGATSTTTTVTGTQTDSQGNVTTINMTVENDDTPVTNRINETNERLKAENQNSSTIIDQLNALIHGTSENGDKLDGIKDAITGIGSGDGTDTTEIESKLDSIDTKLGEIRDGFGTHEQGQSAADSVSLPSYDEAINTGFTQINDILNSSELASAASTIENVTDELTAFESIPDLFLYASQNCTPIPFGSRSLDTCQYAPTISNVLTWASYMLVVIFLFTSIAATLTKIRLT